MKLSCHQLKNLYQINILSSFTVFFQCCYTTNLVFNFKLNFVLKIDLKMCTFKNLEEISQNPVTTLSVNKLQYKQVFIEKLLANMVSKDNFKTK